MNLCWMNKGFKVLGGRINESARRSDGGGITPSPHLNDWWLTWSPKGIHEFPDKSGKPHGPEGLQDPT